MANIQHKDITDPNIHEPKGIAVAAVDTAYVANGSGSGVWKKIDTALTPYMELTFTGTKTASTATSANFPVSFTTVTAGSIGLSNTGSNLTCTKTGVYLINADVQLTVNANAAEQVVTSVRFNKSYTIQSVMAAFLKAVSATESSTVNVTSKDVRSAVVALNVGDEVAFWLTRVGVQPHTETFSGTLNICRIGGV